MKVEIANREFFIDALRKARTKAVAKAKSDLKFYQDNLADKKAKAKKWFSGVGDWEVRFGESYVQDAVNAVTDSEKLLSHLETVLLSKNTGTVYLENEEITLLAPFIK